MAFLDLQANDACAKPKGWLHDQLIKQILERQPGAKATGFMKALCAIPNADYFNDLMQSDAEWVSSIRMVPDAYLIDAEQRTLVVYEAVHMHDLDRHKLDKITELAWALDADSWTLLLCRVDVAEAVFYCPLHMWFAGSDDIIGGILEEQDRYRAWRMFHVDATNARLFQEQTV